MVFQDPWALALRAPALSPEHKWEPQQVLEERQPGLEPGFSNLLAFPGDPTQPTAGILTPCKSELNVASAICHPSTPLKVRTMLALPPPWEQHFIWKFQGEEEGLGSQNF